MTQCHQKQELFGDAIYGGLTESQQQELTGHLSGCLTCAREFEQLKATVDLVRREMPLRPNPQALGEVWSRLSPQLDQEDRAAAWRWRRSKQHILRGLAAAAVFLIAITFAFFSGWVGQEPTTPLITSISPTEKSEPQGELRAHFDQYLDRATPLILSIANRDPDLQNLEGFDLDAERQLARKLAIEAKLLSDRLHEGSRLDRESALVTELEVVFLQIANLYRRQYSDGIDLVRSGLDQRAILFQLSVEEMRRQAAANPSV